MKLATFLVSASMLVAQSDRAPLRSVTAVRYWSLGEVTRVAVQVSGEFEYTSERLHNPERVYYDIPNARPRIDQRRVYSVDVADPLLKRIRVAETLPGITRVVLDLSGPAEVTPSRLANPNRLIVELRAGKSSPVSTEALPAAAAPSSITAPPPALKPEVPKPDTPLPAKPASRPAARAEVADTSAKPEPTRAPAPPAKPAPKPPAKQEVVEVMAMPDPVRDDPPPAAKPASKPPARVETAALDPAPEYSKPEAAVKPAPEPVRSASVPPAATAPPAITDEVGKAARRTSTGQTSLVRTLGLKVSRVVIDPGHGGHDHGTEGPKGLLEKDLVLDIAQRVGKLVEQRMGAEVVYTRTDDTFVPLEGRTALANEKKADLFLSIHANSSPFPRIAGVETYYLNFTDSKDALDVAGRENASSQKSIFELRDLIQTITLHDKAEESREFAARVQTSLFAFSSKNFPNTRNRGVKKAPFVVLIGASMPSVLAEVGFLSNPREENLLRKPDYRQKLAEAIFRGVSRYADSLSHFQVAQAKNQDQ